MTFEIWDLIPEQKKIVKQEEHQIEFAKSSTEMTSTLLNTPWKVEPPGGNTVDPGKEKQAVFISAGGKRMMIKWRIDERRTMWFKER